MKENKWREKSDKKKKREMRKIKTGIKLKQKIDSEKILSMHYR